METIISEPLDRSLGVVETWFAQDLVNVCYVLEIGGNIDPTHLKTACDALSDRFLTLRVNYRDDLGFRPLKKYYITPEFIHTNDDVKWKTIVENEINLDFDKEGESPLWRVTCVFHPKLPTKIIITANHGISDGTSGFLYAKYLMEYMNLSHLGSLGEIQSLPMLPPTEEYIKKSVKLEDKRIQSMFDESVKNDQFINIRTYIPFEKEEMDDSTRRSFPLFFEGSKESLPLIKSCVRRHNLTIGSLVTAIAFFVIESLVGKNGEFSIGIDVNYRDRVEPKLGREFIAAFIGIFDIEFSVKKDTKFWEFAKSIHKEMREKVNDHEAAHWLEFYRILEVEKRIDVKHLYEHIVKNCGRFADLNLSNIGPYPFERKIGEFELLSMYCVNGEVPISYSFLWYLISLDQIFYSFTAEASLWSREFIQRFFERLCDMTERSYTLQDDFTFADYLSGLKK